jgi:hypothetical protein
VALTAADGWAGDQYVVYRNDDKVCMDATIEGDTEGDVAELTMALSSWASQSPKGTAEASTKDGKVSFHSCDPGKDAKAVGNDVTPDTLALPVIRTDTYTQAISDDATPKQAACFADGVIAKFTLDQLNDPKGTFVNSAAGQQVIAGLTEECR